MYELVVGLLLIIAINYPCNGETTVSSDELPFDDLMDLDAEPRLDLIRGLSDINKYLLYTRKNGRIPQNLYLDDAHSILESDFDPQAPTAVLIHGWQSSPHFGLGPMVKQALLDKDEYNVIIVDWRKIAGLDYITAVQGVPQVGEDIGTFLEFLSNVTGISYSSVHLIGHSLGAHVAGNAGRSLDGEVARVTGLDPAGPSWYLNPKRLSKSDAVYVEAIHTNGGGFGIEANVGDVDFYPNGGSLQPGCFNIICHHGRSYELFAASVNYPNHLVGRKCKNLLQMEFDMCKGTDLPLGDDYLQKTGSGMYRLNTGREYPYSL